MCRVDRRAGALVAAMVLSIPSSAFAQNLCTAIPRPCLDQPREGTTDISGQLTSGGAPPVPGAVVHVRVNGQDQGSAGNLDMIKGSFTFKLLHSLSQFDTVEVFQFAPAAGAAAPAVSTGPVPVVAAPTRGNTCDKATRPCIDQPHAGDTTVNGSLNAPPPAGVAVTIKINGNLQAGLGASITGNTFTFNDLHPLSEYDTVEAIQSAPPAAGGVPLPTTGEVTVQSPAIASTQGSQNPISIIIGGVEYSGYSAQAQTTNGFLNMFYRGPTSHRLSGWARIRLTSAPQQATNGVVSVISNPTGLTTFNYSNVGQALDYVAGPTWALTKSGVWSIVAGVGALTPLSSQSVPVTFVAPQPGTNECTQLVSRFSTKNGYNPALSLNTSANPTTCLAGGYTDIAFSNQDRTSFYLKYGGGFRSAYPLAMGNCKDQSAGTKCSKAYGVIDVSVGQDSSVTGGELRGIVFKLDGVLPLPTGSSSWLYLFGSSYMRIQKNENLPPLILQTPNPALTIPSSTVFVLPLRQPNRDYYRIGVGLNINQLWCKAFGSGCSDNTQSAQNSGASPTISSLSPSSVAHGAAADLTLTINGDNFVSASKVQWNGAALTTTYVSSTQVTAVVPKASLATAGSAKVAVTNSAGTSSSTSFTID